MLVVVTKRDRAWNPEILYLNYWKPGWGRLTKREVDADHWTLWAKPQSHPGAVVSDSALLGT